MGQTVAVKRILGEPDAQRLERIRREVQAGRRLSHPALVRIHDLVETSEGPAIIMEAVDGPTLRQALRERETLPLHEALAIHREVLTALEALHGANLLHRDIKPENIFLPREGGVKVGDYSICLPMERTRLTADGSVVGTMGYMAPEQMEGREARPASDLYSAAVVLYETLTGRRPFEGDTPTQTLYAQLHRAPGPGPLRQAGVPRWLRSYLKRCLARRPSERYPSAAAALRALDARRVDPAPLRLLRQFGIAAAVALAIAGAWWGYQKMALPQLKAIELSEARVSGRLSDGSAAWSRTLEKPPAAFLSDDLDGDGAPEAILVGGGPFPVGSAPTAWLVETVGTMTPIFGIWPINGEQGLGGGYRANIMAHDLDRDGIKEVLGYFNSVWYPTQGFAYSVRHRKVTVNFFHPGHIAEVIFADISGDGIEGILFRAMNNVLGHEGVLAGIDGSTACAGGTGYSPLIFMPGWRTQGGTDGSFIGLYTLLPHQAYVYAGRQGTFSIQNKRWSIAPENTLYSGDYCGNLDQGPTGGMGLEGREATLEYFGHIQGMLAAGTAGDRSRTSPEHWMLPSRFVGAQPWDRVFRLVKGRELFRCGARQEGLKILGTLAAELPLDREVNETYGTRLFLATGDWERSTALVLKDADRVLYRPDSARVVAAKIRALAGRLTVEELDGIEDEFTGDCGQLERARILLGMGLWLKAERTALVIPELSPSPYRFGKASCLAVAEAATKGLTGPTLEAARTEAAEYPDLAPLLRTAQAVEASRRGGPPGREKAETLLAPVRGMAAWDLDARLCVAAYEKATAPRR